MQTKNAFEKLTEIVLDAQLAGLTVVCDVRIDGFPTLRLTIKPEGGHEPVLVKIGDAATVN